MKRLVIAEKPSVGQSIAAVLGAGTRKDGYLEGPDHIISWCLGHLVELAGPESYDEKYTHWNREDLPIIPAEWKYKVPRDKYAQFEVLRKLMHREDVSEVINACDAGREGELIFRKVYDLAGCDKPVKRLWISSMEDAAIEEGYANLRDAHEYDNLSAAARCREWADWLVGINCTRLFSTAYHRKLNVGRVVSPTLALLVQREADIEQFQPEPFYTVQLDFGDFAAVSAQYKSKSHAEALVEAAGKSRATVLSVKSRERCDNSPALFDLTTLQREANRALGYTAQQTLDYLQSLYEKKLCTYPRTDSRYLTDDMEAAMRALVLCAGGICDLDMPFTVLTDQVCKSDKVSDHHAIIPTMAAGEADLSVLPTGERELLRLIARQVLYAVSEPYRYLETVVEIECGGTTFTSRGKQVLVPGWRQYDANRAMDVVIPELHEGDTPDLQSASIHEGHTTAPAHHTEDTILSAMENAGVLDILEEPERRGLGTPATRAGIIEKLIATGFVERTKAKKRTNLIPTAVGVSLAAILPDELRSAQLTADWEQQLKAVERGELDPGTFMTGICRMVYELVRNYKPVKGAEVLFPSGREAIGICPRCGGMVTEAKTGFFCERHDCRFGLWRDNRFLTANHITLTAKIVAELLRSGHTAVKNLFDDRSGQSRNALLCMVDDGSRTLYSLDYGQGYNRCT